MSRGRAIRDALNLLACADVQHTEPPSRVDEVLRWAVGVAVVIWVESAAVTALVFPDISGYPPDPEEPGPGFLVSRFVESLAFRVWIGASVALVLRWLNAWLMIRRSTGDSHDVK